MVWFLERAMHGTRKAARLFDAYVIDSFATAGLQQLDYMHMTFVLPELDLEIAVNNEDFVAEGVRESLDALDAIMERFFDVKCLPRIGPPEYGGEVTSGEHLSCGISWIRGGFTCENNLKHVHNLLNLLGFDRDTPGVDTPSVRGKSALITLDEWLDELPARQAKIFRAAAGTLQYIAENVLAIKQVTAEVMQGMAVPLAIHQLRLERVARYLIKHPAEVWHYNYQDNPGVLDEICGADWMSYETTSCIIEKFGQHILDGTVISRKKLHSPAEKQISTRLSERVHRPSRARKP